jgi:biopolymer transport protein ExbB
MLCIAGGFEWFTRGGWAMYPLALLSIWSLYVILSRIVFFNTAWKTIERDLESVARGMAVLPERLSGELAPLLARSLKAGSVDMHRAETAVERELQEASRGVSSLDTIAQMGPMFGLIGTVSGMITVFFQVAQVKGAVDVALLSNGISEALVATWTGLAVAIPAFIAYRAFRGRLLVLENKLYTLVDDVRQIAAEGRGAEPRAVTELHAEELARSVR